jgi:hypothetical protein
MMNDDEIGFIRALPCAPGLTDTVKKDPCHEDAKNESILTVI